MNSADIHIPGYTIHTAIGHGGMASVYLATQESLNRKVAVKVLRNTSEPEVAERFINEARFIAGLNSPHVITIYDISTLENGDCYIAMEFAGGGDLAETAARPSDSIAILRLVRQVAEGLAVVHENEIIHRDVKPSNILFRDDGTAVLTDFGVAKDVAADSDLTQSGLSLGSPSYSSPEQAQCLPIDGTTDIYSLGVVLLELLLGYNPFRGDSHTSTALNHIQLPPPRLPPEIDFLSPLLNRMLAKLPGERYQSCRELLEEIDRLLASEAHISCAEVPPPDRRRQTSSRRAKLIPTALATGGILAAAYFGFFYKTETEREIERLLTQAQASMQSGRYLAPEDNNARDFYRKVLQLDSTNLEAMLGLKTAEQKQLDAYLAQGTRALQKGRLRLPEEDNALHYFRQALALDADNTRARTGISQIIAEYIRLARAEMDESDYEDAHRYVHSGLGIAPDNEALLSLSTRLEEEKARAEQLARMREVRRETPRKPKENPPTVRTYIRNVLDKVRTTLTGDR
ncbi:protein kinase domain-containing protein [Microbulbifer yueqingensis]|uniref:Serine/threonine protein kinase n=1 Tax=Microbulbifer yueqingensis TaxID=658219 RepID=A0A1G9DIF1_9GAMM|nr:protein kinase [Microbulbifer yueqingensis]SDK63555.1 Serine/threonine protein kinase [Microbulbifer yueqingensis]